MRRLLGDVRNPLLRDSVLAGIGAAASRGFLFALNVIVSRVLADRQGYGVFSSVYMTTQLVAMFTSLGIAQTASQAIAAAGADEPRRDRTIRTVLAIVAIAAVAAAALMLLGAPLATSALGGQVPSGVLRTGALLLLAQLLAGGLEGILRGLKQFWGLCRAAVLATGVGLMLAIPLVRALGPSGGLIAASSYLAAYSLLMIAPLRGLVVGALLAPRERRSLLGGTLAPTFANGLAWNLAMMVPPLMLVRSSFGLEHDAVWNASTQLRYFISFAPIVIANSAIPHLAERHARGAGWAREALSSVRLSMGAALMPYVPVVLLARPLMRLYGASYAEYDSLLVLVSTFVLLQVLGSALFVVLLSARRTWETAAMNFLWCVAVLLLAPGSIARGGAYALAWLYLATYVPVLLALGWMVAAAISAQRATPAMAVAPASAWSVVKR